MSKWSDLKDKIAGGLGNWIDSWKDPEAADKSMAAGALGIIAPTGYPEHDGWRKEMRQKIADRKIDREPDPFQDQLTNSIKDIKVPNQEINKDRERER